MKESLLECIDKVAVELERQACLEEKDDEPILAEWLLSLASRIRAAMKEAGK